MPLDRIKNVISTKDKSKAISENDNVEIMADNFYYDRSKNIITAEKNVIVKDKNKNYTIYSEFASYDRIKNVISTKDKSKAISENDNVEIMADNFYYDRSKNIITAEKNVIVKDKNKNYTIYSEFASYDRIKNVISTKDKSKAISENDNVEIMADNFYYDRSKNIITAEKNVIVKDKNKNYTIYSEFASYDRIKNVINTLGKTSGNINNKNFNSSDLTFYQDKMELVSSKPATIDDQVNFYKSNEFKYSINKEELIGNEILITTNYKLPKSDKLYFKSGIINLDTLDFVAKNAEIDIHKDVFDNQKNDPRLKGVSASKTGEITTINKGIFTSCSKDEKCPPWAIQAKEIIHDKENKKITYNNATLKIFDVPVFYLPKFFHPDPTVKRQSGFLQPNINTSTIIGNTISVPYFHVLSENKDLTIKNNFSTEQTNIFKKTNFFQSEYRQENKNSSVIVDFGFVNNFKSKSSNKRKNILHFFAESNIDLGFDQFKNLK